MRKWLTKASTSSCVCVYSRDPPSSPCDGHHPQYYHAVAVAVVAVAVVEEVVAVVVVVAAVVVVDSGKNCPLGGTISARWK